MSRLCIAVVTHALNPALRYVYERLKREAPADHDVWMILSTDDPEVDYDIVPEREVTKIGRVDLFQLPYPKKCRAENWEMAGNLDLVFLEFRRRKPGYEYYWFVEYDVHWEGVWRVLFEHFRPSQAGVLAASIHSISLFPHKLEGLPYPEHVIPQTSGLSGAELLKAFLPICRIKDSALNALDQAYREGAGGHYEIMVPTVAVHHGFSVEDFGGCGTYVQPENVDRFYFAWPSSWSHSPGNFVFRPEQRVLARRNTLWHPVKPRGIPQWHPTKFRGGFLKSVKETLKVLLWQSVVWLWFSIKWRPLKIHEEQRNQVQ